MAHWGNSPFHCHPLLQFLEYNEFIEFEGMADGIVQLHGLDLQPSGAGLINTIIHSRV